MRIQLHTYEDGIGSIRVYPCTTQQGNIDLSYSIDVFISDDFGTGQKKAEVNWAGCGSLPPRLTTQYGEGLIKAAALADYINNYVIPEKVYGVDWLKGYRILNSEESTAYWKEKKSVNV